MRGYLNEAKDRLPFASYMPSMGPAPLADKEKPIYFPDVLKKFLTDANDVFHCPNDDSGSTRPEPNQGRSYFDSEKSSFEYIAARAPMLAGMTLAEAAAMMKLRSGRTVAENAIWTLRDYDNFHGKAGDAGARRYLYIDGHVGDYEN
jgi:hypothetical protein